MPPPLETDELDQTAVLWAALTTGHQYGRVNLDEPVEVSVRWESTYRTGVDPQGNTVAILADVVVDRDVPRYSAMWLGTLDDWNGVGSGNSAAEVLEVVGFVSIPDIKGVETRRTVSLARRNAASPTA